MALSSINCYFVADCLANPIIFLFGIWIFSSDYLHMGMLTWGGEAFII